jgi:putative transposase
VICDEFEAYGDRRVGAELRHHGIVVNLRKSAGSCAKTTCNPSAASGFVATTDSDHDSPIFPDLARHKILDGPNQVWVGGYHPHRDHHWLRLYGRRPR